MKTLLVLISLTAIVTAAPAEFSKDVETFKHINQLGDKNSQFHRQKKSLSLPIEEPSTVNNEKMEEEMEHLAQERQMGLKKPIVIKKLGYHRLRDTEDMKNNCENPVQVKVCDEESETMKPASAARSGVAMTEHEMENSIQMAKAAVENLHRDFLNIERNSHAMQHTRSDTELDTELHSNIDIARKALENIHQNFGDFEAMNLKSSTTEDDLKMESDVERLAQWKDAIDDIQKNIEKVRNIEDAFRSPAPMKETPEKVNTGNSMQRKSELDTSETTMKEMKSEDVPFQSNVADKQRSDVEMTDMDQPKTDMSKAFDEAHLNHETKLKMTTDTENKSPVSLLETPTEMMASELARSQAENTGPMEQFENMAKDTPMMTQDFKSGKTESNRQSTMKSNEPMEPKFQGELPQEPAEALLNNWAQRQSTEDGKQKLFDTLSMRLSENDRNKPEMAQTAATNLNNELMEDKMTRMTPENNMNTQEHMSFKMSPTGMLQQQHFTHMPHSHMPMIHRHHMPKQFDTTDINFDQNNVNVFQNQDNSMMDMNQQQTAEDPFFMRWAAEQHRNNMGPQNAMHMRASNMNDLHNMETMHQLEMSGHDQLSALENMHDHDHMHLMHHANMDSSMQPSMRMNMMDMGRPGFGYNAMQWGNQGLARTSYGPSAPSAPAESSGAVGIFPNAKVGGCAIPLLVSCSPSLATGSLAKPQSSYSAPGYRSGDNMVYYMKRDAKEEDIPVIKVQRSHTPFNHKDEFIVEKTQE